MNLQLQNFFSTVYSPKYSANDNGGASSVTGTIHIKQQIQNLFIQYNIKSMFDSGCNDCSWMSKVIDATGVEYQGGDISLPMITHVRETLPNRMVQVHDATTDAFPRVDLLFVRDVAIHLNNADKRRLWQNWLDSNISWILITHNADYHGHNLDFDYNGQIPFIGDNVNVNWEHDPWGFPKPIGHVWEYDPGGKSMALWNRDQFKGKL